MSACQPSFTLPARIRPAERGDWGNRALLGDYFSSSTPIGRGLECSAIQSLFARALEPPIALGLFAEASAGSIAGLIVENKDWDTEQLSVRIQNLTMVSAAANQASRYEIASRLFVHLLQNHREVLGDCIFARIPSDDASLLRVLEESGFHVLVPMVTLGMKLSGDRAHDPGINGSPALGDGMDFDEVHPETDVDQIERIAATAFRYGRFTADLRIPRDRVEKLHGTWARNCCLGKQADHMIVCRCRGKVLGFIALKFQMAHHVRVGAIELIAISENSRGKGIGRALVQQGCAWLSRFTNYAVVRTELPNTTAVDLYEGQGFHIVNGSLYLSRWQNSPA